MDDAQAMLKKALRESGCVSFLENDAAEALGGLEHARPEAFALLAQDARESMREDYLSRMEMVFQAALFSEMKPYIAKRNPLESVIGKIQPESIKTAGKDLLSEHGADLGTWLRSRYPLLPDYEAALRNNFTTSYLIFFDALIELRSQIVERLLDGRPFSSITNIAIGGDPHRHGRMVLGIETDAGGFYYKPHDCAVDALYHEIVMRWFSDCTTAATVVQGDGVAFVSRLEAKPLESTRDVDTYFRHFGTLTALFHALQSCDMHMENILACADKPAMVDVETLIAPGILPQATPGVENADLPGPQYSVLSLGMLPVRNYRMPIVSPLYYEGPNGACLPEYEGKRYAVAGHEESLVEGFKEGYSRILDAREEIRALIERNENTTIRCLVRNSSFYAIIRQMLYEPNNLHDEKAQREVLGRLESPFTSVGVEPDWEEVRYERGNILQGDIPYFCTTMGSTRLCGEDPSELVKENYFARSAAEKVLDHLDTLCADELRYEVDLIRTVLSRAPIDSSESTYEASRADRPLSKEDAGALMREIVRDLETHAVHMLNGNRTWVRMLDPIHGLVPLGSLTALAEVRAFCALLPDDLDEPERSQAHSLANMAAKRFAAELEHMISLYTNSEKQRAQLPIGLITGFGGVLICCALMERAGMNEVSDTTSRLLEFLLANKESWRDKAGIAEGAAGLALAAALLPATYAGREECLSCASKIVLEQPVPDAPDEAAASAATLVAAGAILGSDDPISKSLECFGDVTAGYDDELGGWRDSEQKVSWLAGRGPHASGIVLATEFAANALGGCGEAPEEIRALRELALASLRAEELLPLDSLARGNALSAFALLHAGDTEAAGMILEGMRARHKHEGCFTITQKGIRSFFEPSLFLGTLGIGWVLSDYQNKLQAEAAT